MSVYPSVVTRQRLGKNITAASNTHNSRRIVGHFFFNALHVLSKESRLSVHLSGTIINKQKGYGRKWLWPNLTNYPDIYLAALR
jgi:hypothetical protein